MISVYCKNCGKECQPTRNFNYCSADCKTEFKKKLADLVSPVYECTCTVCGNQYTAKRTNTKTCSPKCRGQLFRTTKEIKEHIKQQRRTT